MSAPERPKLSDLLAKVSAQQTAGNRLGAASECAFELACQRFAATFFETYSHERAYKAVHPECRLNGKKTKLRAAAYLDRSTRRGKRTVEILTEMWRPVEQVGIDLRVLVDWIVEPFTVDRRKFLKQADNGNLTVHVKLDELTDAELRSMRKVTSRYYPKLDLQETSIEWYDPYRGIDQAIALMALHHRINSATDATNPLPEELTRVLEVASRNRTKFLERLPPSRVRTIIEGKASPAP